MRDLGEANHGHVRVIFAVRSNSHPGLTGEKASAEITTNNRPWLQRPKVIWMSSQENGAR